MHPYFYTPEEEKWIKENIDKYVNSVTMIKDFNATFNRNRAADSLRSKIHHLLPDHNFPFSGGKQKGEGSSSTALPVGSETWRDGYLYVKIANNPLPKHFTVEELRKNWVQKHRLIWETKHGKIPKNGIVVFLDGDKTNFNLSNLYCTDKKVTTVMIRNKWFSTNPEITLTAIKWSELFYTLKKETEK